MNYYKRIIQGGNMYKFLLGVFTGIVGLSVTAYAVNKVDSKEKSSDEDKGDILKEESVDNQTDTSQSDEFVANLKDLPADVRDKILSNKKTCIISVIDLIIKSYDFRDFDILYVKNLHEICESETLQEKLFYILERLKHEGKQVVFSDVKSLDEMPSISERLKKRIEKNYITLQDE